MRENSLILRFLYKILDSKGPPKPFFRPSVLRPIVEILVFGAGAMGSFFGGILSRRHGVTLVGRSEHVEAIRGHGLRISGKTSMVAKPEASTTVPPSARPDLVFVATKAYDTANAMLALERFADRSIFITLQNGLGNAETIAKTAHRVVAGTTAIGVTYVGPGEIRLAHVANGRLVRDKRLAAVVEGICREATAVAKAEGAHLDSEELRHRTILVAKRTAA